MFPVLREGDLLEVIPCADKPVRVGDVVAAVPSGSGGIVVHRVVSGVPGSLCTRGDACCGADPWTLDRTQVLGLVVKRWRGKEVKRVAGGVTGLLLAVSARSVCRILRAVTRTFRALALSDSVCRAVLFRRRPRIVRFGEGPNSTRKLMVGRRVVGWERAEDGRWRCSFPFEVLAPPHSPFHGVAGRADPGAGRIPGWRRWGRELDAVIDACACVVSPARADDLKIQVSDWSEVERLARSHAVQPLLLDGLRRHAWKTVPSETRESLRVDALHAKARSLAILAETGAICAKLGGEGVRCLPLKGPVLSLAAYGDPFLRNSWDVDILIDRREMGRAWKVMEDCGYVWQGGLPTERMPVHARLTGEMSFRSKRSPLSVELSCGVVSRHFMPFPDFDVFWRRRRQVMIDGCELPSLSPEDHLFLCCIHGAKHEWDRAMWVMDVAGLLSRRDRLDGEHVLRQARSAGCERIVRTGLVLAAGVAGVPGLEGWPSGGDAEAELLAERVLHCMAKPSGAGSTWDRSLRFHLAIRERLRDRIRHLSLLAILPSYSDWKAVNLPGCLAFLYFLVRPVRLFLSGARSLPRVAVRIRRRMAGQA
ncbi:MAG: hypothetical protein FJ224_01995 [Lentisphaerae bacterium]|nr:hypothetical protein [Lentisphaerota bacterium]